MTLDEKKIIYAKMEVIKKKEMEEMNAIDVYDPKNYINTNPMPQSAIDRIEAEMEETFKFIKLCQEEASAGGYPVNSWQAWAIWLDKHQDTRPHPLFLIEPV